MKGTGLSEWAVLGSVFLRDRRGSGLVGFAVFFVSIIELLRRDTGIQTPLQNNRIVAAADREQLVAVRCVHRVNHDFVRCAVLVSSKVQPSTVEAALVVLLVCAAIYCGV